MQKTNNLRVKEISPIVTPEVLKQVFPLSAAGSEFITQSRKAISDIVKRQDKRLIAVVGPCSIHDQKAGLEYAERLSTLAKELEDRIVIVMRVYFEKPRTTIGWKGLINDPNLDNSYDISKGLGIARGLMSAITDLELPIAAEMLDPITPQYLSDIICWGAIGARTTESQTHREMASGLSFPVGFKNGTNGDMKVAVDAMVTACGAHNFIGISSDGRAAIVKTVGNDCVHMVLRGGDKPNYSSEDVAQAGALMEKSGLKETSVMIDCSHANSYKDHAKQEGVLSSVIDQVLAGDSTINGVMIESNLRAGNQPLSNDKSKLEYGVSVTDKCIDWETTERILREAWNRLG